uniref:Receptor expression-enhancing protein n=1 Tax=Capra hircus TaxID=9925 RepID=A0A8C2P1W8_CAPHI
MKITFLIFSLSLPSRLIFGTLYPAYYSYKAVKSKDIKEYVKWMMYWIIFALFTTAETFTDIFLCWFPFYYELKIAFVAWLLSPYTKGSSLLYRKFVHPTLSSKEKEIDDCLVQAKDRSYDALVHFGKRGLNVAATAAVMAASKGQGALSERLRSFSMQDLSTIRGDGAPAPSGPPPPGPGRASGKHGQPKMSRSASESAGSSGKAEWLRAGKEEETGGNPRSARVQEFPRSLELRSNTGHSRENSKQASVLNNDHLSFLFPFLLTSTHVKRPLHPAPVPASMKV